MPSVDAKSSENSSLSGWTCRYTTCSLNLHREPLSR